jgi:hypothetical protein
MFNIRFTGKLRLNTTLSWNINTHEISVYKIHDVDPKILNKLRQCYQNPNTCDMGIAIIRMLDLKIISGS